MAYAIRVHETGGPEVMKWQEVAVGKPGPGEILVRHTAVGLNFIDVYFRIGLYPSPKPFTPGQEGAGVVEAVGRGVTHVKVGDRIAYASGPIGSYAQTRVMEAARVVKIPPGITDQQAAAMMLKGLTAQYLIREIHKVKKGETILIHAAAGGVGLIVCQWAKHLGATVIGTVGSKEKARLAKKHGCDHPIVYTEEDFVARVKKITEGKGVPVVYDSIGKATFPASLDCLETRGLFVTFGNASGPVPAFETLLLSQRGSLFLTRPSLPHYTRDHAELSMRARDLFKVVKSGAVKIGINQTWPLRDAAKAHAALQGRATTGSTILLP